MARIRTIKPEFWRDEKIASLRNKLAGYFFIGLWNVADDEGKFQWNPRALSLHLPIFRSKEVVTYLSELSQKGLIQKSECSQWGLITNWNHQRINRPIVPKIKAEEIRWIKTTDSLNVDDNSVRKQRKDRKGKDQDRKGMPSALISDECSLMPMDEPPENLPAKKSEPKANALIATYCDEWCARYRVETAPPIRPQDAAALKRLLKSVGADRATLLVRAYLAMPDSWFVTKRHDIATLTNNLNAVSQFADSGKMISKSEIRSLDSSNTNANTLQSLREGKV